jgi:hypothetical protein
MQLKLETDFSRLYRVIAGLTKAVFQTALTPPLQ